MVTFCSSFPGNVAYVTEAASPLIDTHLPATFRTRGIAAPFTTPLLSGTRVRESSRTGVELVVPNPSGARGVYILQWPGVCALCKPTVHDTLLNRRFSTLRNIDTASIRDAALDVALEGHAGREAAAAAEAALASDRSQRLLAHFLLLMGVVEQVDPNGSKATSLLERTPDRDRRASAALHLLAADVGRPVSYLAGGLAAMGDAFAPVGVAPGDCVARVPRLILRLQDTATAMESWLSEGPNDDIAGLGRLVATSIQATGDRGAALLQATRLPLADPIALLKSWCGAPIEVIARSARCDAFLDGWERVSLLWLCATTDAARRAALLEMIPLMPALPREAADWTGIATPEAMLDPVCRITSRDDAWRSGSASFGLIERNEKLRAMGL